MINASLFNYGDIVRLKQLLANTNIELGDYGVVWAVYEYYTDENKTVIEFDYEGTFENRKGDNIDSMFEKENVEKILEIEDAHFSESMKKLWLYINEKAME